MTRRMSAYRCRMREQGFVEVGVWVPADDKDRLQAFARELRDVRRGRLSQAGQGDATSVEDALTAVTPTHGEESGKALSDCAPDRPALSQSPPSSDSDPAQAAGFSDRDAFVRWLRDLDRQCRQRHMKAIRRHTQVALKLRGIVSRHQADGVLRQGSYAAFIDDAEAELDRRRRLIRVLRS